MNNPSPFIPQGTFLEAQRLHGRSRLKMIVLVVAGFHAALLLAVLIQGCRHEQEAVAIQPASPSLGSRPPDMPKNGTVLSEALHMSPREGATKDYQVVQGDMMSTIARRHGVSLAALRHANPGVDSTQLRVGQVLQVPEIDGREPKPPLQATGEKKPETVSATPASPSGQL